ncbi:MAG: hypothetical protein ACU833_10375 [Gammaproteobacteria bacterium]
MKKIIISTLPMLAFLILISPPKIYAIPPAHDCDHHVFSDSTLDNLKNATDHADSLSSRDEASLICKVAGADLKLSSNKCDDAEKKLLDFEDKVEELDGSRKRKISQEDADCLLEGEGYDCETVGVYQILYEGFDCNE